MALLSLDFISNADVLPLAMTANKGGVPLTVGLADDVWEKNKVTWLGMSWSAAEHIGFRRIDIRR